MNTAIVLAGGSGRRMNSDIPKQYMMLKRKTGNILFIESISG